MSSVAYIIYALIAFGVVLLVASRRRGPQHASCGECGYNLSGHGSGVSICPECGGQFISVGIVPPNKVSRNPWMVICGLIVLLPIAGLILLVVAYFVMLAIFWR